MKIKDKGISFILPCLNEDRDIEKLLGYIINLKINFEIIIVDGGSTDKTKEIVEKFIETNRVKNVIILENKNQIQSFAINLGIKSSKYNFCIRIDCHSKFYNNKNFSNSINKIIELLEKDSYSSIGFKQRFCFDNLMQASIFFLSNTPAISFRNKYRYAIKNNSTNQTAWLFAINKSRFEEVGMLNTKLITNEDFEFNKRLIKRCKKPILIFTDLYIYYKPRDNFLDFAKQYYKYGKQNPLYEKNFIRRILEIIIGFYIILIYIIAILNIKYFYLFTLASVFFLNVYQIIYDKGNYLRISFKNKKMWLYLIFSFLISPFIAVIPFSSLLIGKLINFKKS